MRRLGPNDADLDQAVALLRSGKLVAFPTETVYGLGADASNPDAVRAIFAAKGRPADHPVIVHLPGAEAMSEWATDVPEVAHRLAAAFWPGPMTLVLKKASHVNPLVTGGQDTIGLRVPAHPVARALLERFGGALAAPSANRFGHVSPTTAQHVLDEFDDGVAAVIDGGPCDVGLESTIVDVSGGAPRLLRPGMISSQKLGEVTGAPLKEAGRREGPRASGRLPSHYAPCAPVRLVPGGELTASVALAAERGSVAVLSHQPGPAPRPGVHWQALPDNPVGYAHQLYAALRAADETNPLEILVERVPENDAWAAIADRLERAAA
jgi:L-threonylcarbamoyladenylate synthase